MRTKGNLKMLRWVKEKMRIRRDGAMWRKAGVTRRNGND